MTRARLRLAFTALLAAYGLACLLHPDRGWLLSGVDLGVHETGHLVFAPFGEFVEVLGGTLLQLIMPLAFVAYFARRGDRYAASVALWWVAQNLWNISVYAGDARAQELPLVGGGEHDWAYLLGSTRLLDKDAAVARAIHFAGVAVYAAAIYWGMVTAGDAPAGDAPAGDAPAGDAPAGDAPAGDAPAGDAPAGDAPAGDAPAGDAPTSAAPDELPDEAPNETEPAAPADPRA